MSTDRPQKPPYPKKRARLSSGPGGKAHGKPYGKPYGKPSYGKPRFGGPPREPGADAAPVEWDDEGKTLLFGVHAVEAALANPKRVVNKLFLTENAENRMQTLLEGRGFEIERVTPRDLDRRLGSDTVHQGILLHTEQLEELPMNALLRTARGRPLIVLDQVTDPHNVGAVLRSAAVFGAAGVVMTQRNSPPLNGVLAKSASGALEHIPVALVQNLARSMADLKAAGATLIGLDGEGDEALDEMAWPSQPVFVLGAEGRGLRQLTRETCDRICRISTDGKIASLNVSNAAAVALHLAHVKRKNKSEE
jgi:23S rRNA (guanosine2251-2'-O)-methyltransferase